MVLDESGESESDGRTLIDTNVFLSARASRETEHTACKRRLDAVDDGRVRAVVSVVTLGELRAGLRGAQIAARRTPFLSHLRSARGYSIEPVDEAVASAADGLRDTARPTLPGALILAVARLRAVDYLVTRDQEPLRAKSDAASRRPEDRTLE